MRLSEFIPKETKPVSYFESSIEILAGMFNAHSKFTETRKSVYGISFNIDLLFPDKDPVQFFLTVSWKNDGSPTKPLITVQMALETVHTVKLGRMPLDDDPTSFAESLYNVDDLSELFEMAAEF